MVKKIKIIWDKKPKIFTFKTKISTRFLINFLLDKCILDGSNEMKLKPAIQFFLAKNSSKTNFIKFKLNNKNKSVDLFRHYIRSRFRIYLR